MGLLYLVATIGTGLLGFIYPSFATFKCLTSHPRDNETLESWLFYWVVIGLVAGFEQLGEWIINWAPLYYEAKFLFILWLISPGTQGSTYIYKAYVQPFFIQNTENIDKAIESSRTNALGFVQSSIQALWAFIIGRLTNAQQTAAQNQGPAPGQAGNPAQNGPLQGMLGLAQQMGPAGIAALGSLLSPAQNKQAANQAVQQQSFPNPNTTPTRVPLPPSNPGTPGQDLRYRAPAGANGRNTPPPSFPVPQHQQ